VKIAVPRFVTVGLGAVFSAYMLLLALTSIDSGTNSTLYFIAMVLYAIATILSLSSVPRRMPRIIAIGNVGVCAALPLLVAGQLPEGYELGFDYSTWYVAAIGTLMVITSTRGHNLEAWLGIAILVVHSVIWAGPAGLLGVGVPGSVLWVGISNMLQSSLKKAAKDARAYAIAEREAAEWQAAQEAHFSERRLRLGQTGRQAIPMLRHIAGSGAHLTESQRKECLYLEGAIRDEIRGRTLLSDAVREQVMIARRRGTVVNLLDEGGIDDLEPDELARVHDAIADAIRVSNADTIIVRSVPGGSDIAVTIVGLRRADPNSDSGAINLLGHSADESEEPEIELWLEIPRAVTADEASTPV
jgi:hypothetical protein